MKKNLPASFYQRPNGTEPVREWLLGLTRADRKVIGTDIAEVEFTWPRGMPLCRSLGDGLWEVRSTVTQGRIARVMFTPKDAQMVLLHGFIKKTEKTPTKELELARKRKKDIDR